MASKQYLDRNGNSNVERFYGKNQTNLIKKLLKIKDMLKSSGYSYKLYKLLIYWKNSSKQHAINYPSKTSYPIF